MVLINCFHMAQTKRANEHKNLKSNGAKCIVSLGALVPPPVLFLFQRSFELIMTLSSLIAGQRSFPEFLSLYEPVIPLPVNVLFLCGSSGHLQR